MLQNELEYHIAQKSLALPQPLPYWSDTFSCFFFFFFFILQFILKVGVHSWTSGKHGALILFQVLLSTLSPGKLSTLPHVLYSLTGVLLSMNQSPEIPQFSPSLLSTLLISGTSMLYSPATMPRHMFCILPRFCIPWTTIMIHR